MKVLGVHLDVPSDRVKRLTVGERNEIFNAQGGKCFYCDRKMHKMPEYPDDGNRDQAWFTIANDLELDISVGACRKCNNVQRYL